ncbi:AAA family ATPase [Acinetobacter haemolyticus]|nr:AAA family ATPase [Acinetobacter haemolyticus]
MKFTDEQLHYIERTQITENIFLNACPGSGKTETIAQRVANEVESWANFPSGIAVLSFTKSAAKEIEHRIKEKIDNNTTYPHLMCAELAGDFHLGDSRQLTDKSLLPFDLVS